MFMKHEFVDCIPETLAEGTLYVSIKFKTVVHKCPCGCGNEIVTPLSPAEWELSFNGDSVSLHPSVGNWSLPCRSHYWITKGNVRWARGFTVEEVDLVRSRDRSDKEEWYASDAVKPTGEHAGDSTDEGADKTGRPPASTRGRKPPSRR